MTDFRLKSVIRVWSHECVIFNSKAIVNADTHHTWPNGPLGVDHSPPQGQGPWALNLASLMVEALGY